MPIKNLYGGSMEANLPSDFMDASDLREIPDTQEVFVSNVNEHDSSIIFDLMEYISDTESDSEAVRKHVDEINNTNGFGSESSNQMVELEFIPDVKVHHIPNSEKAKAFIYVGATPISFWSLDAVPTERNLIHQPLVEIVAVIRIAHVKTDIVITLNYPMHSWDEIASLAIILDPTLKQNNKNKEFAQVVPETAKAAIEHNLSIMWKILHTFEIDDWNIFIQKKLRTSVYL